jgi:hypothetical protein
MTTATKQCAQIKDAMKNNIGFVVLLLLCCGGCMLYIHYSCPTVYSPSKKAFVMQDLGGPDYCMIDISTNRTNEQIKLDMEWCSKSAREKRKQEGRP